MSYNKRTWTNGNVVGAVDLNRIENGIADIDVDEIRGWGVQITQLFSETVMAVAEEFGNIATLAYTGTNAPDSMNITYDGTAYACTRIDLPGGAYGYGDINFTDYPFMLGFDGSSWQILTQTAGSHTIAGVQINVETSTEFVSAVNSISNAFTITDTNGTLDKTFAEIRDAFIAGKTCIISRNDKHYLVYAVDLTNLQIYISDGYYNATSEDAYPVYR